MRINKSLITYIPTSGAGSGTVTSVALSATMPTGLTASISGSPITSSGTLGLTLTFSAGYSIPTTVKQSNWDDAYTFVAAFPTGSAGQLLRYNTLGTALEFFTPWYLTSADILATTPLVWNSGTKTMSIPQATASVSGFLSSTDWLTFSSKQNAITLTTTGNSGASTLVGATLNVPEYTLAGLGGFSNPMTSLGDMIYGNAAGAALRRSGNTTTTKMFLSQTGDGTSSAAPQWETAVTSVNLTMPSAFAIGGSPITTSGTLAVTATGNATQYIRGDGALADFPTSAGGGGASVSYYLNGSVNQGTFGGNVYYEMDKNAVIGGGTDFTIGANGYIASFITDANVPNAILIPGGNWNLEFYFSASSGGGSPFFYVDLYKYDGTTFTLIASNSSSPELIAFGTTINPYFSSLAVPETILLTTDRLAIRIYVIHSGRTITLHTEDNHLCQIITTFTTGLTALNNLTKQVQYLATGTSGTDFNISSVTDTHTFNLPTASATNRGALSTTDWTTFNSKQNALNGTGFVKISGTTISYDNSTYYLASNPSAYITLTSLSAGAGISYNNTTGVITSTITQYTDALARASLSFVAGSGAYNSTTGVITIPTNTNQLTNGANYITLTSLSGGSGISYNNTTGVITSTITQYTDALARAAISETVVGLDYNNTTGVFSTTSGYGIPTTTKQTQWDTAYTNRITSLTTTGSSGASTLTSNTLNIPNYTLSGLGGVPTTRTITINDVVFDLSANRSWSVGDYGSW